MTTTTAPRFPVIDIGRGFSVLLMVFVHTLWMYANINVQADSWLGHIIHFIGKGTPSFLIIMGISMSLSSRQSLRSDCLRGLVILGFAYVLNTLKFIVPIAVFNTMPDSFIAAYQWQSPLNLDQYLYLAGTGDILQMVGLSLFIIAIIRHFIKSPWVIVALALTVAALAAELRGFANDHDTLGYIARLFFSDHYQIYFPVFPWMSFILLGLAFGMVLKARDYEHKALFHQSLRIGLASLAFGALLCWLDFDYHFNNFFHLGFGGVLYLFGINMLLFWGVHHLVEAGFSNGFTRFLTYLSRRVTSLYIIQWVIICWGMGIIGYQTLGAVATVLLMPCILLLSLLAQWLIDWVIASRQKPVVAVAEN